MIVAHQRRVSAPRLRQASVLRPHRSQPRRCPRSRNAGPRQLFACAPHSSSGLTLDPRGFSMRANQMSGDTGLIGNPRSITKRMRQPTIPPAAHWPGPLSVMVRSARSWSLKRLVAAASGSQRPRTRASSPAAPRSMDEGARDTSPRHCEAPPGLAAQPHEGFAEVLACQGITCEP